MDDAEASARRYIEECIAVYGGERPAPEAVEKAVQKVARVTRQWQRAIAQQQRRRATAVFPYRPVDRLPER